MPAEADAIKNPETVAYKVLKQSDDNAGKTVSPESSVR